MKQNTATTEEWLKRRAAKDYESLKRRKREMYQLARELGFTAVEAQLLSGWSRKRIEALANERRSDGTGSHPVGAAISRT